MRRRTLVVSFLASALMLVGLGFAAGRHLRSPAQLAAETRPPSPTAIVATVRRGSLTGAGSFTGTVKWVETRRISAAISGAVSPVVTELPRRPGTQLAAGTTLASVADRPIILLPSPVPLYRDLTVGDQGADVARLQHALAASGYASSDRLGEFGGSTAVALSRLYADNGSTAPVTTQTSAESAVGTTPSDRPPPPARPTVVATASELAFVDRLPCYLVSYGQSLGSDVSSKGVATVSSLPPVVSADVPLSVAAELKIGSRVRFGIAGAEATRSARIRSIDRPRQAAGSGFTVHVIAMPDDRLRPSKVGAPVAVSARFTLTDQSLLVPFAAIYSTPDGTTYVRTRSGGRTRRVPVQVTGQSDSTASIVPRRSASLHDGDDVVVGVR